MNMLPEFSITAIEKIDGALFIWGQLDRTEQGKEKWIKDGVSDSLIKKGTIVSGRWYKEENIWQFRVDDSETDKISFFVGETVSVVDGYWGERVRLVFDTSMKWVKAEFKIKGRWDHDHCDICWQTISENENTTHYIGNDQHPICIDCYQNYVKPCDLSFITSP
jgi:hypothetical protein